MSLSKEIQEIVEKLSTLKNTIKECQHIDDEDIPYLKTLFKRKIHHYLIFDLLLRNHIDVAKELLIDFYLSSSIKLDSNIKDHVNDLDLLFESIVDIVSEEELIKVLKSEQVNSKIFDNPRVLEALEFALELEGCQVKNWLKKINS